LGKKRKRVRRKTSFICPISSITALDETKRSLRRSSV